MSSTPGPAYSLRSSQNGIVGAQHYIVTFVIALVIQDYIRNGLELFIGGIRPQVAVLLALGLIILLLFAFEQYATVTGREDPIRRDEVPFEILRALFNLFSLIGLHNFSLVLSRFPTTQISAGVIARQFSLGLAVVYSFYFGIRLIISCQNYYCYGEDDWNQSARSLGLYIIYAVFWYGFANGVPRLGSWAVTALFVIGMIISVAVYIWFWQDRYRTLVGLDDK